MLGQFFGVALFYLPIEQLRIQIKEVPGDIAIMEFCQTPQNKSSSDFLHGVPLSLGDALLFSSSVWFRHSTNYIYTCNAYEEDEVQSSLVWMTSTRHCRIWLSSILILS